MADENKNNENNEGLQEKQSFKISNRNISEEMKESYLDYSMSVIVGRALPDVKDGLKPVHRRILFGMHDMGLAASKPYKKSARIVGDVLGKYHPHGDSAVYQTMVRMVQDFSLRYPLIDGQGNFGSIDGDSAAAMRYTEVRLAKISAEMLSDINKNTVDFVPNYDGSLEEPAVLPSAIPNLLVNGSSGIAVGMATNIPPHNLSEVIDGLVVLINNPDTEITELLKIIKGPDFPTGGILYGTSGIKDYFTTGRGSLKIRAVVDFEDISSGRRAIIIKELPYQVNKTVLLETIVGLVRDKKITGISNIRDESDRDGMRVVIDLKRDEQEQIILNQLYQHTQMQVSFGVIMLALVNNVPKVMDIKTMMNHYINHRKDVVIRRAKFDLEKAEARAHILEGLRIALENMDKVVKTIRQSKDVDTARDALIKNFSLTKIQAQAILDMRLQQLTGLERQKIEEEYLALIKLIEKLKSILASEKKVLKIIEEELLEIRDRYKSPRRTQLKVRTVEMGMEDLIPDEEVVVTMSKAGYVKRMPVDTYRSQRRGGKGIVGMTTREEDYLDDIYVTTTHSFMLLFTNLGRVYWLKVYEIPEAARTGKGKAIVNFLNLSSQEEFVTAIIFIKTLVPEKGTEVDKGYLLMLTRQGTIKKTAVEAYSNPRKSGIIAISLDFGDSLISVQYTSGKNEVVIATRKGLAIRFKESGIRVIGRSGRGVRGIRLGKDDYTVGMEVVNPGEQFLVSSENGYGKRTEVEKYRLTSRGGKGVINMKVNEKTGEVIGIRKVEKTDDIVLVTTKGVINRQPVAQIRATGRATQGVRLIKLQEGDKLVSLARMIAKANEE